mgnify:FL=1|jgi:hypothetical protein|tara:strand:- start:6 stop:476 length:471 start_codon:yes stop_codon:yes gene_type:complete
MSLQDIDPQFRLDSDVAPTYVVRDYDIETGEFGVYYNDGTLKDDNWYGPLAMDLDSMKPDHEEPLRFQIAEQVYNAVVQKRLNECDMESSKVVLAQMMGVEQVLPMEDLMKHRETVARNDTTHVDPVLNATQVVNIFSEDDFDEQFEALSAELAEE